MTEVFDSEKDGISDAEWQELLARASGEGRHFFSENQLYISYARNKVQVTRYIARRGLMGLCMIALGITLWVYSLNRDWGLTLVAGIALTLTGVGMVGTGVVTRRDPAPRENVTRWLAKWSASRETPNLITQASLSDAGPEFLPSEVKCVIIVERDSLLDLLLKNGAHRALSALIVAESGYPAALSAEVQKVLVAHPELRVIAAHDATPSGAGMLTRLRSSGVFSLAGHTVIDAGLFPADVTWLAELAPAIPAAHTGSVPLDSLSYDALMKGLSGVAGGALSLYQAIDNTHSNDSGSSTSASGRAAPAGS